MIDAVIFTMGGCVCDWVFSGMVDSILVENPIDPSQPKIVVESHSINKEEQEKEERVLFLCSNCGTEVKYSLDVMQAFGKVRCQNCGQYIKE